MAEIITSRRNENIVRLRKLISDRSFRYECGEFVCEGIKLFHEAKLWNVDIRDVFVSEKFNEAIPMNVRRYFVSRDILEYASSQKNPQDIIFTCGINKKQNEIDLSAGNILLENIQDPGNLGTILRSAGAFGIKTVLLLGECADPYNPKSVRASMGAVFRGNIVKIDYETLDMFIKNGFKLYGACLSDSSKSICEINLKGANVAIGNEGSGLSDKILQMCNEHVIIPIDPGCESLNAGVAAAVIMWEMSKANK